MIKKESIVVAARQWLGTPYRHQGRGKALAVDCAGVPVGVAQDLGLGVEDFTAYVREPNPAQMQAYLDRNLIRVRKREMQIGDVVWLRFSRQPQHLAIVGDHPSGEFTLIHAYNSLSDPRVVEHILDHTWHLRIVAVWRYPGVE